LRVFPAVHKLSTIRPSDPFCSDRSPKPMQSEYRRADHFAPCNKKPPDAGAFRLAAYGQTTERSSWVCSLGFPRGSRLGPTTSSKANLERAVSCGSFPGMWSCRVAYATISCRRRSGRANPPTLLAKATPARRGPEPRSIAPGNFIRRRLPPRAFSTSAAPAFWASRMIGSKFAANRSARVRRQT
jgi:hypothetical protein